jgi:hypothetical protein
MTLHTVRPFETCKREYVSRKPSGRGRKNRNMPGTLILTIHAALQPKEKGRWFMPSALNSKHRPGIEESFNWLCAHCNYIPPIALPKLHHFGSANCFDHLCRGGLTLTGVSFTVIANCAWEVAPWLSTTVKVTG